MRGYPSRSPRSPPRSPPPTAEPIGLSHQLTGRYTLTGVLFVNNGKRAKAARPSLPGSPHPLPAPLLLTLIGPHKSSPRASAAAQCRSPAMFHASPLHPPPDHLCLPARARLAAHAQQIGRSSMKFSCVTYRVLYQAQENFQLFRVCPLGYLEKP